MIRDLSHFLCLPTANALYWIRSSRVAWWGKPFYFVIGVVCLPLYLVGIIPFKLTHRQGSK